MPQASPETQRLLLFPLAIRNISLKKAFRPRAAGKDMPAAQTACAPVQPEERRCRFFLSLLPALPAKVFHICAKALRKPDLIVRKAVSVLLPWLDPSRSLTLLHDHCPRCGYVSRIGPETTSIPVDRADGEWRCPHCGVRRQWNRELARRQTEALYNTWIFSISTFHRPQIVAWFQARRAAALAAGLSWIAPILFWKNREERIGHLMGNTAAFNVLREQGAYPAAPALDVRVSPPVDFVCNSYLLDKWLANFEHVLLPIDSPPLEVFFNNTLRTLMAQTPDLKKLPLSFSDEEMEYARTRLREMGIDDERKIVLLHCRNSRYLDAIDPSTDWSYNNYRDVDIDTYRQACEFLASKGYYILRTGALQGKALEWAGGKILDYASTWRTEFMDVWLFAHCALCITTGSGPDMIARLQRRPLLNTNFLPHRWVTPGNTQSIYLFKGLRRMADGRLIPVEELLDATNPVGGFSMAQDYRDAGLAWEDNTPEELLAVTKDMVALLDGKLQLTEAELERNAHLWGRVAEVRDSAGQRLYPGPLKYHGYFARQYLS